MCQICRDLRTFLKIKFVFLEDLLRVKDLTFCNSESNRSWIDSFSVERPMPPLFREVAMDISESVALQPSTILCNCEPIACNCVCRFFALILCNCICKYSPFAQSVVRPFQNLVLCGVLQWCAIVCAIACNHVFFSAFACDCVCHCFQLHTCVKYFPFQPVCLLCYAAILELQHCIQNQTLDPAIQ